MRTLLLLGCCEFLPLTRRTFGLGFCLLLAGVYAVKHQLLVYVPVSVAYQQLHFYASLALAVHLLGRFISGRMAMRHAGVPGSYPGTPWLCYIGIPDQAARFYAEPLLALAVALWAAALGMVLPRFQPLFFLSDVLPLPYGIKTPFPLWYEQYGAMIAHAIPLLSALSLALFNRLDVSKPVSDASPREDCLTFSEVGLPSAPAALPVPSAARLARELQSQRKGQSHERDCPQLQGNEGDGIRR
jgi:hypothetical protein